MNRRNLISGCALIVLGFVSPAMSYAFNPQPEPPGSEIKKNVESPLTKKAINPQPEPPKPAVKKLTDPATMKGINPQPEPPGSEMKK